MFRRAEASAANERLPLAMSTFPLVPYSNRIGFCRFEWEGKTHILNTNFPPEPHAIHGTGWTANWTAVQDKANAATLHYTHHASSAWPFPFEAEQQISLSEDALTISINACNDSDKSVPLAFGHHPYFDSEGAALLFRADGIWHTGKDGLPEYVAAPEGQFDFNSSAPVTGRVIDNGYSGWDGYAEIDWIGRPLKLCISANMNAAVVYVPEGGTSFCFEPVPHIINALNLAGRMPQMPIIAPAESYQDTLKFHARPA